MHSSWSLFSVPVQRTQPKGVASADFSVFIRKMRVAAFFRDTVSAPEFERRGAKFSPFTVKNPQRTVNAETAVGIFPSLRSDRRHGQFTKDGAASEIFKRECIL